MWVESMSHALMLLRPTIPGKYFVPAKARDSFDVLSSKPTASAENSGCNTNYRGGGERGERKAHTHPLR